MKVLLTIWISAVLIQEVVPSTLVRYPRQASNTPSFLHTEYEAKIEQKGKHGNESFGTMSGKQAIEHDNCNDNWNAFANKCAALIKDLVASLANSVSSKPGDATNLQLHIKNTFRHLDNTHNCSCLNHTGKGLSDMDLSHLFDNLTLSTTGPADDNDEGRTEYDDEEHTPVPGVTRNPKKLTSGMSVNPENEEDPNSTSNSRRQAKHEPYPSSTPKANGQGRKGAFHPFLTTPLPSSYSTTVDTSTSPPLYYPNKHSPPQSSSARKTSTPYSSNGSGKPPTLSDSYQPESNPTSEAPLEIEPALIVTSGKKQKPMDKPENNAAPAIFPSQSSISTENPRRQNVKFTPPTKTKNGVKSEKPDYDYDEPTSDSTERTTSARPKLDDDSSSLIDPHSYESPDYDFPTAAPKHSARLPVEKSTDNQPTIIPVTNTDSNIPESSEPTTGLNSLSSGVSPYPSDETSYTEDMLSQSTGSTPNSEYTTTESDKTSDLETVTVPSVLLSESPSVDETEDEVLITPKPVTGSQSPAVDNQNFLTQSSLPESETSDSAIDHESPVSEGSTLTVSTDEGYSTTPQSVYHTDEQVTKAPIGLESLYTSEGSYTSGTTEKDDEETEHSTVTMIPEKSSVTNDHDSTEDEQEESTTVTLSSSSPVGEESTDTAEGNDDHTEVTENPVLVQPTTFQTTSEDPTRSPVSTQSSTKFIPVTVASTPQDSDEGTTSESKHDKHHRHDDDDDDEDDCCSCESCTEEEESDPQKVKENVCKSLEEARKELKAIFDKIKKKLRCCRKMPHTITTNTSPLPQ